jgi:hypothetical protein
MRWWNTFGGKAVSPKRCNLQSFWCGLSMFSRGSSFVPNLMAWWNKQHIESVHQSDPILGFFSKIDQISGCKLWGSVWTQIWGAIKNLPGVFWWGINWTTQTWHSSKILFLYNHVLVNLHPTEVIISNEMIGLFFKNRAQNKALWHSKISFIAQDPCGT